MKRLILALLLTASVHPSQAQTASDPDAERPTIALVLSGGAAKGFAHVGALQVFEEEGIPFDVIAGTSAGALIGSFHAVGYSGKQIEEIILSAGEDLNDLFFDRVDSKMLRLEETRIPNQTLARFPMVKGRPTLPQGFVAGQRIVQFLTRYMWGFHQVDDFSLLPRPFICNAVDLVTGQDVELTTGFLPEATRSCVSLPGFFEPFERDSLLLVDGGTSHNLPVHEARKIGGQALVGVDVSGDVAADGSVQLAAGDGGREGSFLFNLTKNLTIKRREAVLELRGELDLVIDPLVGGVSAYNFNNAQLYIERGRSAAKAMIPEIRAFMDSLGTPTPRRVIDSPSLAPVRVESIVVEGVTGAQERLVRALLRLSTPRIIGPAEMDEAISRVYATELFRTVVYKMIPGENGGPATIYVKVRLEEMPNTVGIGFRYDNYYASSLLVTAALRNKIRYGSTTALVFRFGQQTRMGIEYFSRLGLTAPITGGASIDFLSAPIRFASIITGSLPERNDDRPILRQNVLTAQLSLGVALNNASVAGLRVLGSRYTEVIQDYDITDAELLYVNGNFRAPDYEGAKFSGRYGAVVAFLEAQRFNRKAFPTSGYKIKLTAESGAALRQDSDVIARIEKLLGPLQTSNRNNDYRAYRHYVVLTRGAIPVTHQISLYGTANWVRGDGKGLPLSYTSVVGGIHSNTVFEGAFFSLPGLESQERLGTAAWLATLGAQIELRPKTFLLVEANAGDAYFNLSDSEKDFQPQLLKLDGFSLDRAALGLSASLGIESPIGPILVTAGRADGGPVRIGFSAGYAF